MKKTLFIILLMMILGGCVSPQRTPQLDPTNCKCTTVEEYNACSDRYNKCREILSKVVADSHDCIQSINELQQELDRQQRRAFWLRIRDGALSFLGGFGIAALLFLL